MPAARRRQAGLFAGSAPPVPTPAAAAVAPRVEADLWQGDDPGQFGERGGGKSIIKSIPKPNSMTYSGRQSVDWLARRAKSGFSI